MTSPPFTRRGLILGSALAGGAAIGGGLWLARGSGTAPIATTAQTDDTPRRGGLIRVGTIEATQSGNLDAHAPLGAGIIRGWALYAKLWEWTHDCAPRLALAEESETSADGTSLTVRLRRGLEFHHGKSITADDVIFSIRRLSDPAVASPYAALVSPVDRDRIERLDDLTVRLHAKPGQGLVALPETWISFGGIVPTDYHPVTNVVGAGPFRLESFVPGQRATFRRFENYYKPGQPYIDALEIIEFGDQTARAHALIAGQIDVADLVPSEQAQLLRATPGVAVVVSPTNNVQSLDINLDHPQFQDVRVRQALRLLADRQDLVNRALRGEGRVANDLYAPHDPTYNHAIAQRPHDPDQARFLLKQAGAEGLAAEITTNNAGAAAALVFAEQAKQAGLSLTIKKLDDASFNGPQKNQRAISTGGIPSRGFLASALHYDAPTATSNRTNFRDPRFGELLTAALKEPDITKRTPLVHEAQQIQHERGGLLIWGFNHVRAAARANIGGLASELTQFAGWRFDDLWRREVG
ncbi:MAG: ABC transporter substrate-binding protein [Niveispirillum sp.]|uniref:ABC transporter substrate-binding protein n=1 Tax=Niveispirillum sp. TaxID=1917217 RepID=UPI0040357F84